LEDCFALTTVTGQEAFVITCLLTLPNNTLQETVFKRLEKIKKKKSWLMNG